MSPSKYHPYAWPGAAHRASDAELTLFGLLALFSFVSCGALWITHLWVRDAPFGWRSALWKARLRVARRWRRREDDDTANEELVVPPPSGDLPWADRSTLNLLAICCLSSVPWSMLYLDRPPSGGGTSSAYARTSSGSPSWGICLVQGAYVLSWCVFLSAGALGVMIKMWTRIALIDRRLVPWRMPLGVEVALLAYPWFAMLAVTLAGLIEGLRRPQMVLIGQYYCWVASTKIQKAALAISVFHLIIVFALEVHLCFFIRQHFIKLRRQAAAAAGVGQTGEDGCASSSARQGSTLGGLRISVIIRPMFFGLLSLISLGMATVVLIVDRTAPWGKIVLALCPPMAFFAYASDRHLIKQWRLDRLWRWLRCRGSGGSSQRDEPSSSRSMTSSWSSSKYIPGIAILGYDEKDENVDGQDPEKRGQVAVAGAGPNAPPNTPNPMTNAVFQSPTRSTASHVHRMQQWQEALDAYHRRWLEQGPLIQSPPPAARKQ